MIDALSLRVRGGRGGAGCISFLREKYRPKGGPNGGDGGCGGSVWIEATRRETTLSPLSRKTFHEARSGGGGAGRERAGADADDLVLMVPEGTIIRDVSTGAILKDLAREGDRVCVAKGGRGGRGNRKFASSVNRTPRRADPGEEGEIRRISLELRVLADVGLVGFPNAGKSSLLRALSRAKPKVAAYPFTTLHPVLGVVETESFETFTVAEVPGLLEGAHGGRGLGDRFLRHLGRTRFVLYLIDFSEPRTKDPRDDFEALRREVGAFSKDLAARPCAIVATKMDLEAARERLASVRKSFPSTRYPVAALRGDGIPARKEALARRITGSP
ncbi:MAG: GTPase ObgE [Planctomycetota bacterium]